MLGLNWENFTRKYRCYRVLAYDPQLVNSYINLGIIYNKKNDYRKAKQYLVQGEKLAPDNPKIHYQLGYTYKGLKEYSSAINSFQKYLTFAASGAEKKKIQSNIGWLINAQQH